MKDGQLVAVEEKDIEITGPSPKSFLINKKRITPRVSGKYLFLHAFHLMKAKKVGQYLSKLRPDYNLPNIMMTVYFVYYKNKVEFRSISFKPRKKGKNSVNVKMITRTGRQAVKDFARLKKEI